MKFAAAIATTRPSAAAAAVHNRAARAAGGGHGAVVNSSEKYVDHSPNVKDIRRHVFAAMAFFRGGEYILYVLHGISSH